MTRQLSSFMVINADGGDRVTFTYSEVDDEGVVISSNNKKSFFALDDSLLDHINAIREFIKTNRLPNIK